MGEPLAYLLQEWLNNTGNCQCGWSGKRRLIRGNAVLDVLQHCMDTGHTPVGLPTRQTLKAF